MKAAPEYRGFLFHKLGKLLTEECNMPAGTKVELESMEKQLKLLLEKYNIIRDVQLSEVEAAESTWLCHTKKLFWDAEVLVDSFLVPAGCSETAANPDGIENTSNPEIADTKIKKITERGLLLMQLLFKEGPNLRALYKQEEETELVGIDGPRDEVIKMLAEGDDDMSANQVKKVCITGFPGSGKTTLARLVYNQLKPQFDCGAFVRAPGDLCGEDDALTHSLFCDMLSQLDVENHMNVNKSAMDWYGLLNQVKQFLQNKRFLVVFDHIRDPRVFNHLISALANDVYGSRIISTIRIYSMLHFDLSVLGKSVYKMKSLGYLDARKLFLKQFFVCEASFPTAATAVLKEILKMCGGSPSVTISIALVLATRVTATQQWAEMLNSVYSSLKQMASSENFKSDDSVDFEELKHILLLPYSHLPRTLQNCLLYLTVHARNQKIHGTAMVRKWNTIISTSAISGMDRYYERILDKLASRCFDELIDRNFIQLVEYDNCLGEEIYEVNNMMCNVLMWWSQEVELAAVLSDGDTSRDYDRSKCLSIQCSGSELAVYASKMYRDISSITIVGPVKFYVDCFLWGLCILDLDGCKDLDNSAMDHICHMRGLMYLSLKHTQVTEIPPEIRKLINLTIMEIRQTEISNLPPEIGELRSLETLDIRQTEISNLPPEIRKLQYLKTLDASHTKISNLPPEIGKLGWLMTLDASRTQISSVPREIGELQNLETLDISQTEISNLPPEIKKLQKLKTLDASRTQISSVPGEIAELQNLEILDISQTKISNLPPEIKKLQKLKTLDASRTQISSVPGEIAELQNLEILDISQTKISNLPPEIGKLQKLKTLDASRTQISSVPGEIAELQNLEILDISQTKISNLPPEIKKLQKLKTLDASRTQISSVPGEIAELQNLEILDISQTEISNLPPEIGKLQKLKTLDASGTQISCVPPEIGDLQNLETLDVRRTQVKELPKEIVRLPKLAHLYFGQCRSPQAVKLPEGSDQLKSVKVFGTVDSREWSESAMEEISGLTGVSELEIVLHDRPADKGQNDKVLSSVGKCEKLEFLIIHGDYNPSENLPDSTKFPLLERLKIAGRFVKVPLWLAQLTTLMEIYVRVCKLDQDDLKILGGLPCLSNLAIALICIPWKKEVAITNWLKSSTPDDLSPTEETSPAGFMSLKVFSFDCRVPWITFGQGAMPLLKQLHLKLYAFSAGKFPSGITNLHSLEKIILEYSTEYASSGGVTKAVGAVRKAASSHRNLIGLSVNGNHEDFPPNTRVDETITGTEIEEDSNHVNRVELSVNGEHDVLLKEDSNHGNQIELCVNGDHEVLLPNIRVDETKADTEIKECY